MSPVYTYRTTVKRVVDGDTVELTIDVGFQIRLDRMVRLRGINAPEVHGETKARGEQAAAYLFGLTVGRPLVVQTILDRDDKYGRILGVLYDGETNVNARMVADGHAVPYLTA